MLEKVTSNPLLLSSPLMSAIVSSIVSMPWTSSSLISPVEGSSNTHSPAVV